jgi:hypothetical protein
VSARATSGNNGLHPQPATSHARPLQGDDDDLDVPDFLK